MKTIKKIAVLILLLFTLAGCANQSNDLAQFDELDFNKIKTGSLLGSSQYAYVRENYPEADVQFFNSVSENILAIKNKKIDCFITSEVLCVSVCNENDGLDYDALDAGDETAFIFSDNNEELLSDFNEYVANIKETKQIDKLLDKWIFNPNVDLSIDIPEYNPTKKTINVIAPDDIKPFTYIIDGQISGFSIEIIMDFAYKYGYGIQISSAPFDGVIAGVSSGKYDVGVGDISITEERKKNLTFSDPIYYEKYAVIHLGNSYRNALAYKDIDELNGKKMGCMTGSIFDEIIEERLPDSEVVYFNSRDELVLGLKQGKIEGYLTDKPVGLVTCKENDDIGYLEDDKSNIEFGFIFSEKAQTINNEFNEFLQSIKDDGTFLSIQNRWLNEDAINNHYEIPELSGENGTIHACTTMDAAPFVFYKNNQYEGYEVELLYTFAQRYGYDVELSGTNFGSLIPSINSNKYDLSFNGIYITEERKQNVKFSIPTYESCAVAIVRKNTIKEKHSLIDIFIDKFTQTFIEENRYQLILSGIGTTLLISFLSILFGTILGFILYMISRLNNKIINKILSMYSALISGMPVVVLLMILFYIVFSSSSLSATSISILGFTLVFGSVVFNLLKTGMNAIDVGQYEAGLALGYSETTTLFKFILPQALRIIMPTYNSEIVSLVKSSSIVGYITVQDITRVSDVIRSRTYDAFFPLIVTAIIYFVLAKELNRLVNYLQQKFLPNEKSKDEILRKVK